MLAVLIQRIGVLHKYYDTIPGFAGTLPQYFAGYDNVAKEIEARRLFVNNSPVLAALKQANKKQTYLIIIGESLSRKHMGVYGYARNTTPELAKLSDELTVQTNTISNFVQTQPSLRRALTQVNNDNKMPVGKALSMVDIANKAGFKTWWISNQQPLRSTISAIANMADETHYISNDYHGVEVRRFDGFMLPYLKKALNDNAEHKVIFVHLMGSHLQYQNRYPEAFEKFTDQPESGHQENLSSRQVEYINSYDNSVLYTDHVVVSMINTLKNVSAKQVSAALFFSDHGEEVFDNRGFVGHGPESVTPNMVEIPFITWMSAQYRQSRPADFSAMQANHNQPFSLNNDFHFVSSLIGIESEVVREPHSLTSPQYTSAKWMVYKKDYDLGVKHQ